MYLDVSGISGIFLSIVAWTFFHQKPNVQRCVLMWYALAGLPTSLRIRVAKPALMAHNSECTVPPGLDYDIPTVEDCTTYVARENS